KQRTQKKRAPRKFVVHEEDDEEIDDEPLQLKRKKTDTVEDQPKAKEMSAEADT
ncbi:hypothetical protein A2U01_0119222, partial [Trifolium medium]|nr:hypothetical protein [Trifolium medium]